jgi:hypothetical protein
MFRVFLGTSEVNYKIMFHIHTKQLSKLLLLLIFRALESKRFIISESNNKLSLKLSSKFPHKPNFLQ